MESPIIPAQTVLLLFQTVPEEQPIKLKRALPEQIAARPLHPAQTQAREQTVVQVGIQQQRLEKPKV